MQALREQELREFVGNRQVQPTYIAAIINGWPDLERAGINTPLRVCHFLAQIAHETGGFTILREYTNWTPEQMCRLWPSRFKTKLDPRIVKCRGNPQALANLAYAKRDDIGNEGGNDGWDYRGGGFLQTTGRANYRAAGHAIGVDLEGQPDMIEDGSISLRAAIWEWNRHNLNLLADRNYHRAIGNAINRGDAYSGLEPIGFKDREAWLVRAWALFGEGGLPNPSDLALGASGPKVLRTQAQLRDLGYGVGALDGVYGPTMARAVAAFKMDYRREHLVALEPHDIIGAETGGALATAQPVQVSAARANATASDLAAMGSTEVRAGQEVRAAGTILTLAGGAEAARQVGALDLLKDAAGMASITKSSMVPIIDAVGWGLKNAFWAAVILGGVWAWTKGGKAIAARVAAHVNGFNLGR